jgi:DinB superfamily
VNPYTLDEIRAAIPAQHRRFTDYLRGLPLATFLGSLDNTWSPLQHMQHVMNSETTLGGFIGARKFLPLQTPAVSKKYNEIITIYLAALEATPIPNNPFPPPEYGALDALEATRGLALGEFLRGGDQLVNALQSYSDAELDTFQGRHPLLGMMSLREFLLFTVYHVEHHQIALEKRLSHAI